jgi:hypothetical protein
MLDVVLFGILKKHATGLSMLDEEQPAAAFIIKVYHDLKQTMVEVNIQGAFSSIAITHDIDPNPYALLFNEHKFRRNPGFLEVCERNGPLGSLSRRRNKQDLHELTNQHKWISSLYASF